MEKYDQHLESNLDEWADPLGVVVEQLGIRTVYLHIEGDLLSSRKAKDVVLEVLARAPSTNVILPIDYFVQRRGDDDTYVDLAAGINMYIKEGRWAFVTAKFNNPEFEPKKEKLKDFIDSVIAIVGRDRIQITAPRDLDSLVARHRSSLVFSKKSAGEIQRGEFGVEISLRRRESDERVVGELIKTASLPLLVPDMLLCWPIIGATDRFVIPFIAETDQDTPRDRFGLNGFRLESLLREVSKTGFSLGAGNLTFSENAISIWKSILFIRYTGLDGPEEELDILSSEPDEEPILDDVVLA
jgi:hypothetical protein